MKVFCRYLLLTVLLMTSFIPHVVAGWKSHSSYFHQTGNQQDGVSERAAIAIAQQLINGRVLAINLVDNAYHIKILSNRGTVHIVSVNAADGTIMSSH